MNIGNSKLNITKDIERRALAAQGQIKEKLEASLMRLSAVLSKVKMPEIKLPQFPEEMKIESFRSPEQNAWERHDEVLKAQYELVEVLKTLLEDQKSNKKYTIIGLILSALAAIFSATSLIPLFLP